MQVEFFKLERNGRRLVGWTATRGKRTHVPGAVMAAQKSGLPHDLGQYIVEAASHYENGFWDLVAKGATFKSIGRKRTKPGRAVIAAHRPELANAEMLAARHLQAWQAGQDSLVARALDRASEQWRNLGQHQRLVFDWPSPSGTTRTRDRALRA